MNSLLDGIRKDYDMTVARINMIKRKHSSVLLELAELEKVAETLIGAIRRLEAQMKSDV